MYLGYEVNPAMTVEKMGITDVPDESGARHAISYTVKYNMDESGVCMTMSAKLSGSAISAFNEIWLACPTAETNGEILFSRALIDPVFLGADTNYAIAYTLYF
jgi:hypothetical protein